jgi:hypothetical protein
MTTPHGIDYFTIDRLRDFLVELVDLQAWYAWRLVSQEGLAREAVLGPRVRFWPRIACGDDAACRAWAAERAALMDELLAAPQPDAWVAWVRVQSLPIIDAQLADEYQREWVTPLAPPYHGFSFEYHPLYGSEDPQDYLTLHFRNAFMPESPFKHMDALRDGLRRIVERAQKERPDVTNVQCDTWLNGVRHFVSLFPSQWATNLRPGSPGGHMGWWGQFMDRAGHIDARRAEQFLRTGEFPLQHQRGGCTVAALAAHLKE